MVENSVNKKYRSKIVLKTEWIKDLQDRPAMVNDELPANEVNFADADIFEKTILRFKNAGMHSTAAHAK